MGTDRGWLTNNKERVQTKEPVKEHTHWDRQPSPGQEIDAIMNNKKQLVPLPRQ